MPVSPTYPGVYVQEVPSGVRTITGVSTSIALFIGSCKNGPMDSPVQCLNYGDFVRNFSEDSAVSDLPRYVKLFYLNGGTNCYVMRIANGATQASVVLESESGAPVLELTAVNAGLIGNNLRADVTFDTDQPEATFNIELFRWDTDANGNAVKAASELWRNLSMNPTSANYVEKFLRHNSALVLATDKSSKTPGNGTSQAGRAIDFGANFASAWAAILTPSANQFQISVGGSRYVPVDLSPILTGTPPASEAALGTAIETIVNNALKVLAVPPSVAVAFFTAPDASTSTADNASWLRFTATHNDVFIRPSTSNDVAVRLMLGTAQGGLEVGAWAAQRPAPNGSTIAPSSILDNVAASLVAQKPATITGLTVGTTVIPLPAAGLQTSTADAAAYIDALPASPNGNRDGIREKLRLIQKAVADFAAGSATFDWTAEVWGYRLTFRKRSGADSIVGTLAFTGWAPTDLEKPRFYSLGATPATAGSDGSAPKASDYAAAYPIIDREVDLFNLLVLPSAADVDPAQLWGAASVFCQQRRALLLMDPPTDWSSVQDAKSKVDGLRIGLVKDYASLYFPYLTMSENGLPVQVGPTGAIAGLMARIDGTRGVWKAPAGTEADIRGIIGLEKRLSDNENGVLNPKAINALRVFPNGVVSWGARTMDGDDSNPSDFKYVPIRRLSLFIEESLYRGLKWVVFEPNDEPLWGQVRLNVGAFMHSLFVQGAFQGKTTSDAYFVRCDAETTTQDDRNKGIVNIWVGFAPLKPAEFVVLYLQQMAGQIAV